MRVRTTHVGSLPHTNIKEAIDFTFRFDIPVLFSLPRLDPNDGMGKDLLRLTDNWTSFNGDFFLNYEEAFFEKLHSEEQSDFKVQLIGPISMKKYFLEDHSIEQVAEKVLIVYQRLVGRMKNQGNLFFVVDEPGLVNASEVSFLNRFLNEIIGEDFQLGVHCCSDITKEDFCELKLDFKQLDWSQRGSYKFGDNDRFFGGLEETPTNNWGEFSFFEKDIVISPSCGLALETDIETRFQRLIDFKNFLKTV